MSEPAAVGEGAHKTAQRHRLANWALAAWLAADAIRIALFARDLRSDVIDVAAAGVFLGVALIVLRRPRPVSEDTRASAVGVALLATLLPALLAWLVPEQGANRTGLAAPALVAQGCALLLMAAGLLYLGCNFSVVPQYRTLVTAGPYALVRHPIYASYLLFDGVLVMEAGSLTGGGLWLAEATLLLMRARIEETLLAVNDPNYANYLSRVRWRFAPGIV